MFKSTITLALRNLLRHKLFSVINIIGLSVSITCAVVIFIFIRYESNFDSFHQQADNTYRIVQHTQFPDEMVYWNTTAYPLAEALRNDFTDFALVTQASGPTSRTFSVDDGSGNINRFEEKFVLFVDQWYTKVFDLQWLAGNRETAFNDPNSVVLTQSLIAKCFQEEIADPSEVLGKTILLNEKDPLTITGVVADAPGNTNLHYNILVPYSFFRKHNEYYAGNWSGNYQGTTFVVLKNNSSKQNIERQLASWKKKYLKPEDDKRISYFLQPLNVIHNESLYGSSPGSYTMPHRIIHAATAIAVFILIIASVNFVNLATAQAATRAKEVGVRKVIGGTRSKLVFHFAAEHAMLIFITLLISVGLTQFALVQLNDFLTILNLRLIFQWTDFFILAGIGVVVVLLSALYPALVLASFKPVEALKNKAFTGYSPGPSLRKVLVILQFSIVQFFIIATIIISGQMQYMKTKDLGFAKEAVIVTPAPPFEKLESFRQKMMEQGAVADVAFGANPPTTVYDIHYGTSFRLPGQPEELGKGSEMKVGDLNYIEFFNLELLAGRNFTRLKEAFDEFIVNEKLVKALGWTPEEAVGRKIVVNEGEGTIVGVLKDFHNTSLQSEITPCVMYNWIYFQDWAYIKTEPSSSLTTSLAEIEKIWKDFSPNGLYRYEFLDDLMEMNYANENMIFLGFTISSVFVILIGCLGLFGLVSFMTVRKTKEIGIRKVLGASITQIISLFSKEFVWLVMIALIFAAPLAYMTMNEWLTDFAYHIPIKWWMFVMGGAIGLAIALATVSYQSARAALANPVDSLRSE